jgi:hypothetical protein
MRSLSDFAAEAAKHAASNPSDVELSKSIQRTLDAISSAAPAAVLTPPFRFPNQPACFHTFFFFLSKQTNLLHYSLSPLFDSFFQDGGVGDIPADAFEDPAFQTSMETMVRDLLSKDFLYEPMRDLRERYPLFLRDNKPPALSEGEFQKYTRQFEIVTALCATFEEEPSNVDKVMKLMEEMQETGHPPPQIVAAMAPEGVELDENGQPKLPGGGGCSVM